MVHTIDTLFPVDARTHTMTSVLDSRPQAKGDPDRKAVHSSDDAVDSEAASMVFDGDGVRLLGGGAEGVQKYGLPESRKIGVAGAFFLILNKMIGTGSECFLVVWWLMFRILTFVVSSLLYTVWYFCVDRVGWHLLIDVGCW